MSVGGVCRTGFAGIRRGIRCAGRRVRRALGFIGGITRSARGGVRWRVGSTTPAGTRGARVRRLRSAWRFLRRRGGRWAVPGRVVPTALGAMGRSATSTPVLGGSATPVIRAVPGPALLFAERRLLAVTSGSPGGSRGLRGRTLALVCAGLFVGRGGIVQVLLLRCWRLGRRVSVSRHSLAHRIRRGLSRGGLRVARRCRRRGHGGGGRCIALPCQRTQRTSARQTQGHKRPHQRKGAASGNDAADTTVLSDRLAQAHSGDATTHVLPLLRCSAPATCRWPGPYTGPRSSD